MANGNGENPRKNIDQTESTKKLPARLKCAESLATKCDHQIIIHAWLVLILT